MVFLANITFKIRIARKISKILVKPTFKVRITKNIVIDTKVQEMMIVSEAGLYSLILRSRKPEAKAFKRWVTHEVLPSIRKTGAYLLSP